MQMLSNHIYKKKLLFAMPCPKCTEKILPPKNPSNSRPKGIILIKPALPFPTTSTISLESFPLPLTHPPTITLRQNPLHPLTPPPFPPTPDFPLPAHHLPLYAIDDAHGDKEIVAVGA